MLLWKAEILSIFTNPNSCAINFVIVPFPVPAGPSIATTNGILVSSFIT